MLIQFLYIAFYVKKRRTCWDGTGANDGDNKMAVMGITAFKERFKDYDDCYTIIGGTACDILNGRRRTWF